MAQTHLSLFVHLVFRTHHNRPSKRKEWRQNLHAYLGGCLKTAPHPSHRANFLCALGTIHVRFIAVVLLALLLISACSSRVEISPPRDIADISPNAINLNTASIDELDRLPHIGRKTAEAIVAFREEHGPFRRPEHLMLVRGVSETRFLEIRHLLRTR